MSVLIPPGAIALAVIRFGPPSAAKDRVKPSTADFDPAYRAWLGTDMPAAMEDMKMIRPPSFVVLCQQDEGHVQLDINGSSAYNSSTSKRVGQRRIGHEC